MDGKGAIAEQHDEKIDIVIERLANVQMTSMEMKASLLLIQSREEKFEKDYIIAHSSLIIDLTKAVARIDALEKDIKQIKDQLSSLIRASWGIVASVGIGVVLWVTTNVLPSILVHIK